MLPNLTNASFHPLFAVQMTTTRLFSVLKRLLHKKLGWSDKNKSDENVAHAQRRQRQLRGRDIHAVLMTYNGHTTGTEERDTIAGAEMRVGVEIVSMIVMEEIGTLIERAAAAVSNDHVPTNDNTDARTIKGRRDLEVEGGMRLIVMKRASQCTMTWTGGPAHTILKMAKGQLNVDEPGETTKRIDIMNTIADPIPHLIIDHPVPAIPVPSLVLISGEDALLFPRNAILKTTLRKHLCQTTSSHCLQRNCASISYVLLSRERPE